MKKWLIENKVYIYMKEKKEGHKKAKGINKLQLQNGEQLGGKGKRTVNNQTVPN